MIEFLEVVTWLLLGVDAARSRVNASVACQIDLLERLELAEGGR